MAKKPFPVAAVVHHYLEKWSRDQWAPHRHFQADTTEPLQSRHARINLLYRASKAGNADYLSRLFTNLIGETHAPPALRSAFITMTIQLALDNKIAFDLPDLPATLQFSEERELTGILLDIEHRLKNEEAILSHFDYGAALVAEGMTQQHIPPLVHGAALAQVELLNLLIDPKDCIQRILVTFVDELSGEPPKHLAFQTTRDQLMKNLLAASRLTEEQARTAPHRIVLPENSDLSVSECARVYLAHTPFLALLHAPVPFTIPRKAYTEHAAMLAPPGHGKTQSLQHLIVGFLKEPNPPAMFIIDSQGAMLDLIQRLKLFENTDRLIILDPPEPALNFFQLGDTDDAETMELAVYLFSAIDRELTAKQATAVPYLLKLLKTIPNASLDDLRKIMGEPIGKNGIHDSNYRDNILQLDPLSRDFFATIFYDRAEMGQTRKQVATRLFQILGNDKFRLMFSANENRFDAYRAMQEGKCVLINTHHKKLGVNGSAIFGRFMIAQVLMAAYKRDANKNNPLALLIMDEAHEYFDEMTERILAQARKYSLGLLCATQLLHKMDDGVRAAIFGNTSIKFAGPVQYGDALALSREMHCDHNFIQAMRDYQGSRTEFACYVRTDRLTPQAVKLTIPFFTLENEPSMDEPTWKGLRAANRARYGAQKTPEGPVQAHRNLRKTSSPVSPHEEVKNSRVEPQATTKKKVEPPRTDTTRTDLDTDH